MIYGNGSKSGRRDTCCCLIGGIYGECLAPVVRVLTALRQWVFARRNTNDDQKNLALADLGSENVG